MVATVHVTTSLEGNIIYTLEDGTVGQYNLGDLAWVTVATAIVAMFVPGLGLLYSGLLRRKNALSMIFLAFAVFSVGQLQWLMFGYSLSYSDTGNAFLGNFKYGGYNFDPIAPSPVANIPILLYAIYQAQFCAITLVVVIAGAAERCRMLPVLVFLFLWASIVYCPVAYWTWNANGWLYTLGELDFAGGGPVHIASGIGSFMLSVFLGPRRGYGTPALDYRPQSTTMIAIGTSFIWFGWLCFNGASMSAMNLKSISCVVNTNIAASSGALAWTALDFYYTRKYSASGICSGILAGMIGITPAVGYVSSASAIAVGGLTAIAANFATGLKRVLKVDDPIDAGALHGIGGIAGSILTGIFASAKVSAYDGFTDIPGGWIDQNYKQMGYQLAGSVTITAYTALVTYALLVLINLIPGLKFRCSEEYEVLGIDETEIGEYAHDYLHINRDIDGHRPSLRGRSVDPKSQQRGMDESPSASSQTKEVSGAEVQEVQEVSRN